MKIMMPSKDETDSNQPVMLPNHPFRTSTHEAMQTLSAGVGKGSNRIQGKKSNRASLTFSNQLRSPSSTSIHRKVGQHRTSTLSPAKSFKDDVQIVSSTGQAVNHSPVKTNNSVKSSLKTAKNRFSRFFVCGRNTAFYEGEAELPLQTLPPANPALAQPSIRRKSSFFSLSAKPSISPDVEFEEAYVTSSQQQQTATPIQDIENANDAKNNNSKQDNVEAQNENVKEEKEEKEEHKANQSCKADEVKNPDSLPNMTLRECRYDTIPSSEACEYTGRKSFHEAEASLNLSHPPTSSTHNGKENDNSTKSTNQTGNFCERDTKAAASKALTESLRSIVSSSSLYSAASAQERTFINTPGQISLADEWGISGSPSRSITSTQLGQSPFIFDLLSKFPGIGNSTSHQPSGLRQMLDSDSLTDVNRVTTPHPPGFMSDSDSEQEQDSMHVFNLGYRDQRDTPPARLRREKLDQYNLANSETLSPASSLSNSTLETPSPPLTSLNRKRLAILKGSQMQSDYATRMASMEVTEEQNTDWRDNLIGLYTDDDIILPFPQIRSEDHRQSVSSTTDSFHSTDVFQNLEDEERLSNLTTLQKNMSGKIYEKAPVPPPEIPLPPIPTSDRNSNEIQSLSKSQRTIRNASHGNRHRGNSDASAHSNLTMKAVNRSKYSQRK